MKTKGKWCPYEVSQPKTMKNNVFKQGKQKKKLIHIPFLWRNWWYFEFVLQAVNT